MADVLTKEEINQLLAVINANAENKNNVDGGLTSEEIDVLLAGLDSYDTTKNNNVNAKKSKGEELTPDEVKQLLSVLNSCKD